ncbi:hypothetical protein DL93DRAFT_2073745 [Clavulina sp. PMI_390]|nr:hypothetical protein DL93DRAFT_2073745 [Clavulina sp. PMI_390]
MDDDVEIGENGQPASSSDDDDKWLRCVRPRDCPPAGSTFPRPRPRGMMSSFRPNGGRGEKGRRVG